MLDVTNSYLSLNCSRAMIAELRNFSSSFGSCNKVKKVPAIVHNSQLGRKKFIWFKNSFRKNKLFHVLGKEVVVLTKFILAYIISRGIPCVLYYIILTQYFEDIFSIFKSMGQLGPTCCVRIFERGSAKL